MMTKPATGTMVKSARAKIRILARKIKASTSMPAARLRRLWRNISIARNSSTKAQAANWPLWVAVSFTGTPKYLVNASVPCGHSANAEESASNALQETR